jgi:hypothetical protein
MEHAVKHKGALRQAAHRAGMSTQEYAKEHEHSPGATGRRARLGLIFNRLRPKN